MQVTINVTHIVGAGLLPFMSSLLGGVERTSEVIVHGRGNKRANAVTKCIITLIFVAALATLATGIYAITQRQVPLRGSQAMPAQVAERLGESPRPSARPK